MGLNPGPRQGIKGVNKEDSMSVALAQERARKRTVRMRDTSAQDTVVDDRPRRQRRLLWIGAAGAAMLILGIVAYPASKPGRGPSCRFPWNGSGLQLSSVANLFAT